MTVNRLKVNGEIARERDMSISLFQAHIKIPNLTHHDNHCSVDSKIFVLK